jgi:hypothetical protein
MPALGYTVPYAVGNILLTAWGPGQRDVTESLIIPVLKSTRVRCATPAFSHSYR